MLKPRKRCLLAAIQGLGELADVVGVFSIHKSHGLVTVDSLGQLAMQECVLDIELMHGPATRGSEVQHAYINCNIC